MTVTSPACDNPEQTPQGQTPQAEDRLLSRSTSGFGQFAAAIATLTGRPATFTIACALIIVWAASGPVFHWSDTWQLVINTSTTIVTFLMVFVIQNAQNRDAMAIQVKLDELICATQDARDKLVGIEDLDDAVVERLRREIRERSALSEAIQPARRPNA